MPKIQMLTVVLGNGLTRTYGTENAIRFPDGFCLLATEIEQNSLEYESGIFSEYRIYGPNKSLLATVENCPVIVEYESE